MTAFSDAAALVESTMTAYQQAQDDVQAAKDAVDEADAVRDDARRAYKNAREAMEALLPFVG